MKLISLNIWAGRVEEALLDFLKRNEDIDIFCLQEVYFDAVGKETVFLDVNFNIYEKIEKLLSGHTGYYRPHLGDYYGLAIFVKKGVNVLEEDECFVHRHKGYIPTDHVGKHAKNVQYMKVENGKEPISIINFHGLWNGNGKGDTPERIEQSQNIKKFLDGVSGKKILCGDFNLLPDTESLKILSYGMRDLIKDHGIQSTRSELYSKPVRFADYVLVSPELEVKKFEVLPDVVSDHFALSLEFK